MYVLYSWRLNLLDPDPAKNGPDPQPWPEPGTYHTYLPTCCIINADSNPFYAYESQLWLRF